ncbi:bifunctional 3-dehydroquinate dehydratase/shikimate dehydrogenase, chloroplastic-like [Hibiscus syriacus]|uniref:bifunctional 3-dehydroquinate dehydratase/shikimate dehydrogenase, chloroplastic-like n=1 Tax=Hibiscus syriacus TaxID=106335 RepID=UPI0019235D3B|nr:bifunctional 3-dehydroquinate dehydratase/shikimate dehydrogenase, chloroplastic-like [Hibiscus syriacus]
MKYKNQSATKFIVSCHVTGMTPSEEELSNLVSTLRATGAYIFKAVVNVTDITEIARIFHLLYHCQVSVIAYSVEERGHISQLLCPKFGGFLAYGSIYGYSIPGIPYLQC